MIFQQHDIITFNGITVNTGNAYDPDTGVFRCPLSGYYAISGSIYNGVHMQQTSFKLMKDDSNVQTLVLSANDIQLPFSTMVACESGEEIYVQYVSTANFQTTGSASAKYNTFYGYIIRDGL